LLANDSCKLSSLFIHNTVACFMLMFILV
jgi:hypothetical protein